MARFLLLLSLRFPESCWQWRIRKRYGNSKLISYLLVIIVFFSNQMVRVVSLIVRSFRIPNSFQRFFNRGALVFCIKDEKLHLCCLAANFRGLLEYPTVDLAPKDSAPQEQRSALGLPIFLLHSNFQQFEKVWRIRAQLSHNFLARETVVLSRLLWSKFYSEWAPLRLALFAFFNVVVALFFKGF